MSGRMHHRYVQTWQRTADLPRVDALQPPPKDTLLGTVMAYDTLVGLNAGLVSHLWCSVPATYAVVEGGRYPRLVLARHLRPANAEQWLQVWLNLAEGLEPVAMASGTDDGRARLKAMQAELADLAIAAGWRRKWSHWRPPAHKLPLP